MIKVKNETEEKSEVLSEQKKVLVKEIKQLRKKLETTETSCVRFEKQQIDQDNKLKDLQAQFNYLQEKLDEQIKLNTQLMSNINSSNYRNLGSGNY